MSEKRCEGECTSELIVRALTLMGAQASDWSKSHRFLRARVTATYKNFNYRVERWVSALWLRFVIDEPHSRPLGCQWPFELTLNRWRRPGWPAAIGSGQLVSRQRSCRWEPMMAFDISEIQLALLWGAYIIKFQAFTFKQCSGNENLRISNVSYEENMLKGRAEPCLYFQSSSPTLL